MGKVKVRVVGDETTEKEQKEEQKLKREAKKQARGLNMGGGQRINSVGVSEEEIASLISAKPEAEETSKPEEDKSKKTRQTQKEKKAEARVLSKRHTSNKSTVATGTIYPVKSGIEILRRFKKSKFDETVELHVNVKEKGISGQVTLPHGSGKKLRIRVADDALIAAIEQGKIDFDVLIAEPSMMPKLAKVARVLGPRGLMPNPKAGTVTDKPQALIEKLSAGQINYKTESGAPIIHMSVGKLSFEDAQLAENINQVLSSIGPTRIENITLKSTMSPAVRLQI